MIEAQKTQTPEELEAQFAALQALGMAVAEGMHEPFEPRAIAYCFARRDHMAGARPRLTMQGWIDLEAARSPFLIDAPSEDPMRDVEIALRALGWWKELEELRATNWRGRRKITVRRLAEITVQILAALRERHSTGIAMRPPRRGGDDEMPEEDGFGNWGPVLACLISEMHFTLKAALGCEVSAAFALIAAMRRNQGWKPKGDNYRAREVDVSAAVGEEDRAKAQSREEGGDE